MTGKTTLALAQIAVLLALAPLSLLAESKLPAFPGAEGFGAETPGGRDGKVIEVTNLNDQGPGSFRAACEAKDARIVVFRTGGMVEIHSPVVIREPFITIAGQTAPGDGIMLKANPGFDGPVVQVATHDVVIRGLRIRRGPTRKKGCCGDAIAPRRDAVDKRVINEVRSKAGRCIDDPSDVGGWPTLDPGKPPADTDHDGIPDAWEKQHRLNPHNPEDRNETTRGGYTWVEEYINSLVPRTSTNKGGRRR